MMLLLKNIGRLRWALAFLLFAGGGATAIALSARHHVRDAKAEGRQAAAQRDEARGKLSRVEDEAQEIRRRISRYRELVDKGLIGQEHRLEWVERIAQSKAARRLIEVRYELGPQRPIDPRVLPETVPPGSHEFLASTMSLQMQLLHEDDLLGFLADLRPGIQAHLHIRSCSIERIPRGGGDLGPVAQLRANCTIDWVTLRERK